MKGNLVVGGMGGKIISFNIECRCFCHNYNGKGLCGVFGECDKLQSWKTVKGVA